MSALDELLAEQAADEALPVDPAALAIAEAIRDELVKRHQRVTHGVAEVKAFEVRRFGRRGAFVTVEIGSDRDEGTLAAAFCRDHRHFMIANTARRGLKLLNPAKGWKSKVAGRFNVVTTPTR